ncbi:MAG: hypothetical protein HKN49_05940 [Gammaproteobacteria bacterium]|nr:hypothetical protein [Gammaproteobacteria bacterium]
MEPMLGYIVHTVMRTVQDLTKIDLGQLFAYGIDIVLEAKTGVEMAFFVGVINNGRVISLEQSETFTLQPATYRVNEANASKFQLQPADGSNQGTSVTVPNVILHTEGLGKGRFGDPRYSMSVEPVIYDYEAPQIKRTLDSMGLEPDATVLVITPVPADPEVRQSLESRPAFLPIEAF